MLQTMQFKFHKKKMLLKNAWLEDLLFDISMS